MEVFNCLICRGVTIYFFWNSWELFTLMLWQFRQLNGLMVRCYPTESQFRSDLWGHIRRRINRYYGITGICHSVYTFMKRQSCPNSILLCTTLRKNSASILSGQGQSNHLLSHCRLRRLKEYAQKYLSDLCCCMMLCQNIQDMSLTLNCISARNGLSKWFFSLNFHLKTYSFHLFN